jgi:hypothetical protein
MTQDAGDPVTGTRNMRALASVVGAAAAPPALVIALAYYFAVKRQEALALHFGIDTSVLGYSTQDYLLRGGDALFLALLFVSLAGLLAIAAHVFLTRQAAARWSAAQLRATSVAMEVVGAVLLVGGLVAVFQPLPLNVLLQSLSFGVGILLLAYGVYFHGLVRGSGFFHQPGREGANPLLVTTIVLIGLVVFLSLFWATKDLAQALGRGQAEDLESRLARQPGATIYSTRRLYLPGVQEDELTGGGYGFRYSKLRLLVRSGDRYLLIQDGWSRDGGVVFVLRDDNSMRIEFMRGGSR